MTRMSRKAPVRADARPTDEQRAAFARELARSEFGRFYEVKSSWPTNIGRQRQPVRSQTALPTKQPSK